MSATYIRNHKINNKYFKHGFFGRKGGVSQGYFDSLNCSLKFGDTSQNVFRNREIIANTMGHDYKTLKVISQKHTNTSVIIHDGNMDRLIEADAMVTKTPGILLAIQTADCCPLFFADVKKNIIGMAHAGWRGAINGILQNTIRMMQYLGSDILDISVTIGPAISQRSYEVDDHFMQKFLSHSSENEAYFIPDTHKKNVYYFDLKACCRNILFDYGIGDVEDLNVDTYAAENDYFSCRRSYHMNIPFGGQLSVASIIQR